MPAGKSCWTPSGLPSSLMCVSTLAAVRGWWLTDSYCRLWPCCFCTHWKAVGRSCAGSKRFPGCWCTHTCTCDCRCIPSCAALSQLWLECSTLPYALCVGEMLNCASPPYLSCPLATRSCRHKDYPHVQLSLVNLNISSPWKDKITKIPSNYSRGAFTLTSYLKPELFSPIQEQDA